MKRKYLTVIAITILTLILLPLFLNEIIFDNNYFSKVSNDGWASFLGSYIGGVVGGIGTLIAMYTTVKQAQKQFFDTENKSKMEDKKRFTDKVSELVVQYISDLQICRDKEGRVRYPREKLVGEWQKYYDLQQIWKMCRKDRYFNGLKSYYDELFNRKISSEYPKRCFRDFDWKCPENSYDKYEKDLENKLEKINNKLEQINGQIDEYRQKYIIGNNAYLLLEIKLENIECAKALWEVVDELQNQELKRYDLWNFEVEKQSFDNQILNIKKELRKFNKNYLVQ